MNIPQVAYTLYNIDYIYIIMVYIIIFCFEFERVFHNLNASSSIHFCAKISAKNTLKTIGGNLLPLSFNMHKKIIKIK